MKLVWETPAPKRPGRTSKNEKILAALKANPGQWARVAEGRGSSVGWFKDHGCEATGRTQPGGIIYTYARWPEPGQAKNPAPGRVKTVAPKKTTTPASKRKAVVTPIDAPKDRPAGQLGRPHAIRTASLTMTAQQGATARAAANGETTGNCECGRRQVNLKNGQCRTCRLNSQVRKAATA